MQLVIEVPSREQQVVFNRQRWAELLCDSVVADLPFRIETNAHGQILMTPPPSGQHSARQGEIVFRLRQLLGGNALPECPVSTVDGVRAADVGWYSEERFGTVRHQQAFELAPEICVEVISPGNTPLRMKQKKQLSFEAGAEEVWFCQTDGKMDFFGRTDPESAIPTSVRCPDFPESI